MWSVFITTGLSSFTLPWGKGTFPPVESLSASRNFSTLTLNSHVGDTFHMSPWRLELNSTNLITDLPTYVPMLNSALRICMFSHTVHLTYKHLTAYPWLGWNTTHFSQACLKFRDQPVSASQVLYWGERLATSGSMFDEKFNMLDFLIYFWLYQLIIMWTDS